MNEIVNKTLCEYKNLIVHSDSNKDIKNSNCNKDKL